MRADAIVPSPSYRSKREGLYGRGAAWFGDLSVRPETTKAAAMASADGGLVLDGDMTVTSRMVVSMRRATSRVSPAQRAPSGMGPARCHRGLATYRGVVQRTRHRVRPPRSPSCLHSVVPIALWLIRVHPFSWLVVVIWPPTCVWLLFFPCSLAPPCSRRTLFRLLVAPSPSQAARLVLFFFLQSLPAPIRLSVAACPQQQKAPTQHGGTKMFPIFFWGCRPSPTNSAAYFFLKEQKKLVPPFCGLWSTILFFFLKK